MPRAIGGAQARPSGSRTEAERRAAARRREQARREAASRRSADFNREYSTAHRTLFMILGVVVVAVVLFLLTHYL